MLVSETNSIRFYNKAYDSFSQSLGSNNDAKDGFKLVGWSLNPTWKVVGYFPDLLATIASVDISVDISQGSHSTVRLILINFLH